MPKKRNHLDLEVVTKMIQDVVEKNKLEGLAKLLVALQSEYIEVCILATDGKFDPDSWSHKRVLNFLTKGE